MLERRVGASIEPLRREETKLMSAANRRAESVCIFKVCKARINHPVKGTYFGPALLSYL